MVWYTNFVVILCLIIMFCIMLRILQYWSDAYKRMLKRRVDKALEARKLQKDPFRNENGYSWDYVMVFKVFKFNEKLTDKQKNPSSTLKGILNTLAEAGLQTKLFYSVQNDEVYCKIRAPLKRLLVEADRIEYKMYLDPSYVANALAVGNLTGPEDRQWKPIFIPSNKEETSLDPTEFIYGKFSLEIFGQLPIYKKYSSDSIFRGVDRLKLISSIISSRRDDGGCQLNTDRLIKDDNILAFFPLHDLVELRSLENNWMTMCQHPGSQNINAVKDYYGEKIGLFYAWLGHYTSWLIIASIAGFFSWFFVAAKNDNPNAPIMPYFAAFITIWGSFYLEYWKRYETNVAMRWGMIGYEETAQTRSEFIGTRTVSPIDGSYYLYFPKMTFYKRLAQSISVIIALIAVVIAALGAIFYFRIYAAHSGAFVKDGVDLSSFIASILNAIQIQIMNYIYSIVSIQLNDYENHRTDIAYDDALIAKTFVFQFVNSYVSLFYIAFIKPFISQYDPCVHNCMSDLSVALGTIFLVQLATGSILKIVIPSINNFLAKTTNFSGLSYSEMQEVSEVEKAYILTPFNASSDTFNDYAEMIIFFGYTTMFIVAYPLATCISLVNNYVAMRVMAWRINQLCRRPEPKPAEDIGTWADILEIMTNVTILTNSALVVFTGTFTRNYTWPSRLWIFIAMMTILMTIKLTIQLLVPDVSRETEIQLQRQDYIVSKIIDNIGDESDESLMTADSIKTTHVIRITDDDPL